MKPINLKIKGLNSFLDCEEIEFSKLTEKGLFGIFGPTGSGKSTILDAITIAMYGEISRNTKEFINTETDKVEVSYEFEIGQGNDRRRYVSERCIKRNKNGVGYKTTMARLREKLREAEEESILADGPKDVQDKIIEIVGLKAEDFTRSVVLPQGKFNEFLKLTGKDRRNMLERIFALEKFGSKLCDKIRSVKNQNLKELSVTEGEMKGYENTSQEAHDQIKEILKELKQQEKALKEQKTILDKEYEECKILWQLQQELKDYKNKELELEKSKNEIEENKEKVIKGKNALIVKPFIDNIKETEQKIKVNEENIKNINKIYDNINEMLTKLSATYEVALEEKNKNIPILIKQEANLSQAISIEERIKVLEEQREELKTEYKKVDGFIRAFQENINKIEQNKIENVGKLESSDKRLSEIEISPEYREKLQKAYNKEIEYAEVLNLKETVEKKLKHQINQVEKSSLNYEKVIIIEQNTRKIVTEVEEKQENLQKYFPGDNNLLFEKQNLFNTVKEKLDKAVENHNNIKNLKECYEPINKNIDKITKEIHDFEQEALNKKQEVQQTEEKLKQLEINNLASILSAEMQEGDLCPVCGSSHHPKKAEKIENVDIEQYKKLKKKQEKEVEKLNIEIQNNKIKLAEIKKDEEHIKGQLNLADEALKEVNIELLKAEVISRENEFKELRLKIERYEIEKNKIIEELSKAKEEKSKIDKEEAKLKETLNKDKEVLAALEIELKGIEEKFNKIKTEYINVKIEIGILNLKIDEKDITNLSQDYTTESITPHIKNKLKEIKLLDEEASTIKKQQKSLRDSLVALDKSKEDILIKLNEAITKKAEIETSGKEKRKEIDNLNADIQKLCEGINMGGVTPKEYIEKVVFKMNEINKKEQTVRIQLEKEKEQKLKIEKEKSSEEKNGITLNNLYDEQQEKLKKELIEQSFKDIEEVTKYTLSKTEIEIHEKEINSYEKQCENTKQNINRVNALLQGRIVEEEKWNDVKIKREETIKELENKTISIGENQKALKDMEKSLEDMKVLLNKKKQLEHKLSLLKDIDTLVQGNKFVEFVATSQLKYIALEASKRLKDITRGRYALEIDSESNFVMRDDFSGGCRRDTSTLSGGETFLTSLCLALALSSQIQLKGSAPLEFFFLDEGFGTLDVDLLETVIGSLERLHSERLSVGIITHVEEIKNRVPVKLIVTPANHGVGGSKVKLEYS